ncbi:MAG: 3-hydroxyacyl-CoA dehydrogenase NAD-binding domain-containing protein [Piscinibacter sp.]
MIREEPRVAGRPLGLVNDPDASAANLSLVPKDLADAAEGLDPRAGERPRNRRGEDRHPHRDRQAGAEVGHRRLLHLVVFASRFTENLHRTAACLVAHPVNPPHLVPIVELCPSPWTDPKMVEKARAIYEKVGQVPVTVRKRSTASC